MLVRMLVGHLYGAAGSEVNVAEDEAIRLFSARYAVPALPKMERAVIANPAVEQRKSRKKK